MFSALRFLPKHNSVATKVRTFSSSTCQSQQQSTKSAWKVGVIMSGCGYLDGTEITEAVSTLIHLNKLDTDVVVYAPTGESVHTVNHNTEKVDIDEVRDIQSEVSRITRGRVHSLNDCNAKELDAIFFPGGYGVAKHLSNNYKPTEEGWSVNPQVEAIIQAAHKAKTPMGFFCVAPILAARTLGTQYGGKGVTVTVGNNKQTIKTVTQCGAKSVTTTTPDEVVVDEDNLIASTPAYMLSNANHHEVFEGIGNCIEKVQAMFRKSDTSSSAIGNDPFVDGLFEEFVVPELKK